jgi:hypothetical protein
MGAAEVLSNEVTTPVPELPSVQGAHAAGHPAIQQCVLLCVLHKSESNHDALISACGPILRTGTGERLAFAEAMMLALMVAALLTG